LSEASRRQPVVLVADDEGNFLRLIASLLQTAEFEVLTARDGDEALTLALDERPDAAVLDVNMPKRTGNQVMEAIRANESTHEMAIILMSAYDRDDVTTPCCNGRLERFVRKPFRSQELIRAIQDCIAGS
jgi:CheY-like chemotaxis protein